MKTARREPSTDSEESELYDLSIGALMKENEKLSDEQIEEVLIYQRKHRLRFGEAAIALRLVSSEDVLSALSRQFHYPYSPVLRKNDAELIVAAHPFSDESELFRELRSQLLQDVMSMGSARRALAVTSPNVGDGKTFIAANLAVAFSQLGGRTLLIDADLRTPRQHQLFDLGNTAGLTNILSGRNERNAIHQINDLPSLFLMPAGGVPPNPLELVERPAFGLLMGELLVKFDYVIVDTPAASHGADARVIATKCGSGLVVGRKGTTKMSALEKLSKSIAKSSTLAGIVVNNR